MCCRRRRKFHAAQRTGITHWPVSAPHTRLRSSVQSGSSLDSSCVERTGELWWCYESVLRSAAGYLYAQTTNELRSSSSVKLRTTNISNAVLPCCWNSPSSSFALRVRGGDPAADSFGVHLEPRKCLVAGNSVQFWLNNVRAGLRHVRGVRPNRAADFRGCYFGPYNAAKCDCGRGSQLPDLLAGFKGTASTQTSCCGYLLDA